MPDPEPAPDFHLQPAQGTGTGGTTGSAAGNGTGAPASGSGPAAGSTVAAPTDVPIGVGAPPVSMTPEQLVLATAAVLVLAVAFFFVRGGLRAHLISRRASLASASAAGWSLFALLLSVAVAVAFGVIGDAFRSVPFDAAMAVLVLATAVLAVLTWRGALRRRR